MPKVDDNCNTGNTELLEVTEWKEADKVVKLCGERHAVLQMIGTLVFRGSILNVLLDNGTPVSYNVTYYGKKKKNVWEPYANWYVAYTVEGRRREGLAKSLALYTRSVAVAKGCRRLKSLAGSNLGLRIHGSLGDEFWGLREDDGGVDVVVDTPLIEHEAYKTKPPPLAQQGVLTAWGVDDVLRALNGRPLRWDQPKKKPAR